MPLFWPLHRNVKLKWNMQFCCAHLFKCSWSDIIECVRLWEGVGDTNPPTWVGLYKFPRTSIWWHTKDSEPSEDLYMRPRKTLTKNAENVMFYHLRVISAPRISMVFKYYYIYEDTRVLRSISTSQRWVCGWGVSDLQNCSVKCNEL